MPTPTRKRCPRCCAPGATLPVADFPPCRSRPDGLQTYCRDCYRTKQREYHANGGNRRRAAVRENTKRARERNRRFIIEYLERTGCADCGVAEPVVLEFHHVGSKTTTVCPMVGHGFSRERIEEELRECIVLCANCHRRRTATGRGYYRAIDSSSRTVRELQACSGYQIHRPPRLYSAPTPAVALRLLAG